MVSGYKQNTLCILFLAFCVYGNNEMFNTKSPDEPKMSTTRKIWWTQLLAPKKHCQHHTTIHSFECSSPPPSSSWSALYAFVVLLFFFFRSFLCPGSVCSAVTLIFFFCWANNIYLFVSAMLTTNRIMQNIWISERISISIPRKMLNSNQI